MLKRLLFSAVVAVAVMLTVVPPAVADTTTAPIQVSAVVVANCRLTVVPLAFGEYDPTGTNLTQPLDAEASLQLYCGRNASAVISLDSGGYAAAPGNRQMNNGGSRLAYGLYRDSARSLPWAEGGEALTVGFTELGSRTVRLFGRVAQAQAPLPGTYTDVVTARVDF